MDILDDDLEEIERGELGVFGMGMGTKSLALAPYVPKSTATKTGGGFFSKMAAAVKAAKPAKVGSVKTIASSASVPTKYAAPVRTVARGGVPRPTFRLSVPRPTLTLPKKAYAPLYARRAAPAPLSSGPRPGTSSAAYRHMCSNAGLGGGASIALLKQILALVQLQDTRATATNEHNVLNNTKKFRRKVLKRLSARLRNQ